MSPLVKQNFVIGTRGSKLAVVQAEQVRKKLSSQYKDCNFSIKTIQTSGDKFLKEDLSKIGGKGLFIKEIEAALKREEIHLAVHSLKDMPTTPPEGFVIAGVLKRADPRDVFISNKYSSLSDLDEGALIGTSSARRKAILLEKNSKIRIINFRGNVITRLKKLDEEQVDGIILSYAGLERLKLTNRITEVISLKQILPSPGQGAICMECLSDNKEIQQMILKINHPRTLIETNCEREFLKNIEGDCKTPIAAYAKVTGKRIKLEINIIHPFGISNYYDSIIGDVAKHLQLASMLSDRSKYKAHEILEYIKRHA